MYVHEICAFKITKKEEKLINLSISQTNIFPLFINHHQQQLQAKMMVSRKFSHFSFLTKSYKIICEINYNEIGEDHFITKNRVISVYGCKVLARKFLVFNLFILFFSSRYKTNLSVRFNLICCCQFMSMIYLKNKVIELIF